MVYILKKPKCQKIPQKSAKIEIAVSIQGIALHPGASYQGAPGG